MIRYKTIISFKNKILFFIIIYIFFCNHYYKKKYEKIKVCLCVIGKLENIYAKEYVNHYKKLGYDHIYIYDNNNNNSERFSDILFEEIKIGFVSINDFIGFRGKYNNSQYEAYYDCYNKYSRYYDWLSFFDFDEFLDINTKTIQEFLDKKIYKNCQNIKINWLVYNSYNESLFYENKPLKKRFINIFLNDASNKHIKSTVRGKIKKNYWSKWLNPHSSGTNFKACSSSGKKIDSKTPFVNPPDYKNAFLKHFSKKSFEEFCLKLKRGWPDITDNMIIINNIIKSNKNNKEKRKIIHKIFNITN